MDSLHSLAHHPADGRPVEARGYLHGHRSRAAERDGHSEEGAPEVSTDAGSNASAIVLKGKDLDALSDDPDELSNELTALAGPSAGPNGGQIYIDGFTGGTLPPKSAIREIRINQNPFSAEFDHIGYGRIEILTKPGTDELHGRGFLRATTAHSIPATHSPRRFPRTTASSTTAPSAERSTRLRPSSSAWRAATARTQTIYTVTPLFWTLPPAL